MYVSYVCECRRWIKKNPTSSNVSVIQNKNKKNIAAFYYGWYSVNKL